MVNTEQIEYRGSQMYPPFPEGTIREARALRLPEEIFKDRKLVQGVTIDSATSKDLDDAIWVEKIGKGYRVSVSIADVSTLIPQNSALDREAFARAFTRYYANGNSPMLPRQLSEGLLSLHEDQLRPTITITTPLDENLEMGEPMFELTKLENMKRFSYEEVDKPLADRNDPLHQSFSEIGHLALNLLAKRRERGALAFYDIRRRIATSEEGILQLLTPEQAHISNIIVQELMILTSESVALFLAENQTPTLFRNHKARPHAPPRESLLRDIENVIDQPEAFDANVLRSRMGIVFDKASYSPVLEGHYGLNLEAYSHFTSPIRRYADLVNHRILTATIKNEKPPYSMEELAEIGDYLNATADNVQKQKSTYLKESAYATARTVNQPEQLRDADKKVFSNVVKVTVQKDTMPDSVANEIIERLENNRLDVNDAFAILTKPQEGDEGWQRVYKEIMRWLKENPYHAVYIATLGSQKLGWSIPFYETTFRGPDNARTFTSTTKIVVNKEEYISKPISASTKKASQQLATLDILPKLLGVKASDQESQR